MKLKNSDKKNNKGHSKISKKTISNTLLTEVAWEACNQVGGIYTVLRSKAPTITAEWGENYCLIGPYVHPNVSSEFEESSNYESTPFGAAAKKMNELGFEVKYGKWLVTGRPNIILVNPFTVWDRLGEIKYLLWEHHDISIPEDDLMNKVVAFGSLVKVYFDILANKRTNKHHIIAQFHEWMASTHIPELRLENVPISIVFTTHATLLGRYLAMNDGNFYKHLPFYDWISEAKKFNIEPQVKIERAAAHGSHVFTTVSDVTANECRHLLGREPDVVLPNGINIDRFAVLHEFQNIHQENKEEIHRFVMGHFFQSYSFDLDSTLYFFTSGRFEYKNKGFDLTMEALARLNYMMQRHKIHKTVVMFFITKNSFHSINPNVLQSRALMEELRKTCKAIEEQVGDKLFYSAANLSDNKLPNLSEMVEDYWRLRFRRTLQSWKSDSLPPVVTHNLVDSDNDPLLGFIRNSNLVNKEYDKVKIIYHPDFISPTNPLFGIEYNQFVRGCHLGIFPSYYEPWGYTPLECLASGVPSVTSDLSGFGDYIQRNHPQHDKHGAFVVRRSGHSFSDSAHKLAESLFNFVLLDRRQRIEMRNKAEASSVSLSWENLIHYYYKAYNMVLQRTKELEEVSE